MYICDVGYGGKAYLVMVDDSEYVTGVVEKENREYAAYCTVYESDGVTICEDLYTIKRVSMVAKEHLKKRLQALQRVLLNAGCAT